MEIVDQLDQPSERMRGAQARCGQLRKARLKPLCPVAVEGPGIIHCKGIGPGRTVNTPPPPKLRGGGWCDVIGWSWVTQSKGSSTVPLSPHCREEPQHTGLTIELQSAPPLLPKDSISRVQTPQSTK
ncbi:hypothetical protein AOXY_G16350 [Acipenser oxyrinchus oxyrinchus]|uniref:Uncharacterized protein n=1 Tax=Acipenser oxyrinchus oxyrinchus TaxID=40147 RepID=A0AAD8D825_ACIOX|nr:hypothetical protein AOXY_G16350 [Acipenser oxyrinchus oxyrinchus]